MIVNITNGTMILAKDGIVKWMQEKFITALKNEKRLSEMLWLMATRNMDNKAIDIVRKYIFEHLDKSDPVPEFEVFTVWKSKVLQNWKYLISSTLFDGMYYELTYNGDKHEWYLDAYKKFENRVIAE